MNQNDILYLMALNRIAYLKTREKLQFLELCGSVRGFFSLSKRELEYTLGRKLRVEKLTHDLYLQAAEKDCLFLERNPRANFLYFWDPGFPVGLREIYDPPLLLFYRGQLPSFMEPLVAVVGTRHPTGDGRSAAFKLAAELSEHGIGIVSGLARGCDAAAHQGSFLGRGIRIAVLGNGIDQIYPLSNRKLGLELLEHAGVIFSEFPPGTPPLRYNFPKRNRIISGMARSVVVIQAPLRSGALITADYALGQGRDLYVHKAGLQGDVCAGSKKLAEEGALVIENSSHLFYDWGWLAKRTSVWGEEGKRADASAGLRLAERMMLELNEHGITYNGDFFRRL